MIAALLACRGGDTDEPAGWDDVDVQLAPFSLTYGGARLARIEIGLSAYHDEAINHDPWRFYADDDPNPPNIDWQPVWRAAWEGDALRLSLPGGETARLERRDGEGLGLALVHEGATPAPLVRLVLENDPTEGLYGLGEQFASTNHRGAVRAMQIEYDPTVESSYNEQHVPVPFLVGSSGWGVGVESDWPMVFDVAYSDDDVHVLINEPDGVDFRLFSDTPVEVIRQWTRTAGLPRLPPSWAFAPMQWRDEDDPQEVVLEDLAAMRDGDFAFGVVWVDNPWQTTYNSMVPDPAQYPDWDALIATAHASGFRMLAWNTPYLEAGEPDHATYADNGWFVDLPIAFNGFGDLVDLTNPDAKAAWGERVSAARARGIEGFKMDYGEDVQLGVGDTRLVTAFFNGEDERTMHHRFAAYYHAAYADPYGDADRFILGRGGAWGTAAITDCIWPGDLDSDLRHYGEDGHVGGLPSAIRGGIGLSVSGFPAFASDTGGYRHERADEETIVRWTEYSALMPFMQVGGGSHHNYWIPDGDWTELVPEVGRRYTQLHTRLYPFFRTLLTDAHTNGTPPVLPVGLAGGGHDDHATFVVGGALLVAPVEEEGAITRDVALPAGRWVHWWTGEAYEGEVTVPAPLGEGPLFLGEGGIVPLLRASVRTLSPSDGSVDSWADDPGVLTLRFVPGDGRFDVSDGPIVEGTATSLTIGDPGIYTGLRVEVWAPDAGEILVDGAPVATERDGVWLAADVAAGVVTWR